MDYVYIHKGYSWYVPLAIRNGTHFCSGNVYYLGDLYGCGIARLCGAHTARINDYNQSAIAFETVYKHYSTLGAKFELFCIQRWFILRDFMKDTGIKQAIYLDTDNLVCEPLDGFVDKFQGYGMTFTGYSAHINFILDWTILDRFCQFIMDIYRNPDKEGKLVTWAKDIQSSAGAGGVSDMTMFYWFHQEFSQNILSYKDVFMFPPFDGSLEDTRECEADQDGFKKIAWEGKTPFVIMKDNQSVLKLVTLHHQGRAKKVLYRNASMLAPKWMLPKSFFILMAKIYGIMRRIISNI